MSFNATRENKILAVNFRIYSIILICKNKEYFDLNTLDVPITLGKRCKLCYCMATPNCTA